MNIGGYLVEAVETWLEAAKDEREVMLRANGVFGSDLDWRLLQPAGRSSLNKIQESVLLE